MEGISFQHTLYEVITEKKNVIMTYAFSFTVKTFDPKEMIPSILKRHK